MKKIKIKSAIKILTATFFALVFCLFTALFLNQTKGIFLKQNKKANLSGSYTFYLYSPSSNAQIVSYKLGEKFNFYHLNGVKGESLFLSFKDGESAVNEHIAGLLCDLNAVKTMQEEAEEVKNCYYYSKDIANYIVINGKKVNLHVAYGIGGVTIGSPIIFGSY